MTFTKPSRPCLTLHLALLEGQPEIVAALSQAQNITILAPSNEAFAKFLALPGNENVASQTDLVAALLQVRTSEKSRRQIPQTNRP